MVRIAVSIYPEHAEYADIRRAAAEAEALGVDGPAYDFSPVKDWLAWRGEKNRT